MIMKSNYLSSITLEKPIKMKVLIDTGAEDVNVMSEKLIQRLGNAKINMPLKNSNLMVKPMGSKAMKTLGSTKLPLEFNNGLKTESIPFVVVKEMNQYDLILGLPAIEQLRILLDINKGVANILGQEIKLNVNNYQKQSEIRTLKTE